MNSKTAFLLIDVQDGFLHPTHWGPSRSNPQFEPNAISLISAYRELTASSPYLHKLIHIQHASGAQFPDSLLQPTSPGFKFQDWAIPKVDELVVVKNVNSAFIGTNLEEILRVHFGEEGGKLYMAGLTTDHCCSSTARMAGNLGVANGAGKDRWGEILFIGDATAAWKKGTGPENFEAEVVHAVHVESLKEFATIRETKDVLQDWRAILKT